MHIDGLWIIYIGGAVASICTGLMLVRRYVRTRRTAYLALGLPLSLLVPGIVLLVLAGGLEPPFRRVGPTQARSTSVSRGATAAESSRVPPSDICPIVRGYLEMDIIYAPMDVMRENATARTELATRYATCAVPDQPSGGDD